MKKYLNPKFITEVSIWLVVGVFLLIVLLRQFMFPADSLFRNMFNDITTFDEATRVGVRVLKTLVIVCAVLFIARAVRFLLQLPSTKNKRAQTMLSLLKSITKYVAFIVLLILILATWGVDTTTIVTSASIITLVVGLGCQSLIADVVAGLFILFEGDFQVGDTVVIDGWRGVVQSIGIRTTKVVDISGNVKIINNSKIDDIVNNSKQLSVAAINVDVDYEESIERVESVIEANLDYLRKRIPAIVEGPYYKGVEALNASGVTIKLVAKCNEDDKYQVQRDMNREIKIIFDKNGVAIPFDQVVISMREKLEEEKFERNMDAFVDEQRELSKDFEDVD